MTDQTHLPTEPLRAEHRELLPHLVALDTAADEVDRWDRAEAFRVLSDVVHFLREHLVPHAAAEERLHFDKEEAVLLPVLDAELDRDEADALFARMGTAAHA